MNANLVAQEAAPAAAAAAARARQAELNAAAGAGGGGAASAAAPGGAEAARNPGNVAMGAGAAPAARAANAGNSGRQQGPSAQRLRLEGNSNSAASRVREVAAAAAAEGAAAAEEAARAAMAVEAAAIAQQAAQQAGSDAAASRAFGQAGPAAAAIAQDDADVANSAAAEAAEALPAGLASAAAGGRAEQCAPARVGNVGFLTLNAARFREFLTSLYGDWVSGPVSAFLADINGASRELGLTAAISKLISALNSAVLTVGGALPPAAMALQAAAVAGAGMAAAGAGMAGRAALAGMGAARNAAGAGGRMAAAARNAAVAGAGMAAAGMGAARNAAFAGGVVIGDAIQALTFNVMEALRKAIVSMSTNISIPALIANQSLEKPLDRSFSDDISVRSPRAEGILANQKIFEGIQVPGQDLLDSFNSLTEQLAKTYKIQLLELNKAAQNLAINIHEINRLFYKAASKGLTNDEQKILRVSIINTFPLYILTVKAYELQQLSNTKITEIFASQVIQKMVGEGEIIDPGLLISMKNRLFGAFSCGYSRPSGATPTRKKTTVQFSGQLFPSNYDNVTPEDMVGFATFMDPLFYIADALYPVNKAEGFSYAGAHKVYRGSVDYNPPEGGSRGILTVYVPKLNRIGPLAVSMANVQVTTSEGFHFARAYRIPDEADNLFKRLLSGIPRGEDRRAKEEFVNNFIRESLRSMGQDPGRISPETIAAIREEALAASRIPLLMAPSPGAVNIRLPDDNSDLGGGYRRPRKQTRKYRNKNKSKSKSNRKSQRRNKNKRTNRKTKNRSQSQNRKTRRS